MHVRDLPADRGMLFLFERPQYVAFWMKDTFVSLDLVFIGPDGVVVNIREHATPHSLEAIESDGPVSAVLEVVAGTADRLGIAPAIESGIRHSTAGVDSGQFVRRFRSVEVASSDRDRLDESRSDGCSSIPYSKMRTTRPVAVVPGLVLDRVVKDERFADFPASFLETDVIPAFRRDDEAGGRPGRVGFAVVRRDSGVGCEHGKHGIGGKAGDVGHRSARKCGCGSRTASWFSGTGAPPRQRWSVLHRSEWFSSFHWLTGSAGSNRCRG